MAARAEAGLDDPALMDLRGTVAKQKAIVDELWDQIGDGGSLSALLEVQAAWEALLRQPAGSDQTRMAAAVEALGGPIDSQRKVEEVSRHLERQARLVKTAYEADLDKVMAVQFALEIGLIQRALNQAAEKFLPDPEVRRAFMGECQRALERVMHHEA